MKSTRQALVTEGIQGSCQFMELGLGNEKNKSITSQTETP
jgi:hypothetical protein